MTHICHVAPMSVTLNFFSVQKLKMSSSSLISSYVFCYVTAKIYYIFIQTNGRCFCNIQCFYNIGTIQKPERALQKCTALHFVSKYWNLCNWSSIKETIVNKLDSYVEKLYYGLILRMNIFLQKSLSFSSFLLEVWRHIWFVPIFGDKEVCKRFLLFTIFKTEIDTNVSLEMIGKLLWFDTMATTIHSICFSKVTFLILLLVHWFSFLHKY